MREGRGVAMAIATMLFLGFALLPAVLAPLVFLFFTVMGMTKGTDFRAATLNLPVLFAGIALIVAMLVTLLLAGAGWIGRSLTPARRSRR
jgi:hypothetical protein